MNPLAVAGIAAGIGGLTGGASSAIEGSKSRAALAEYLKQQQAIKSGINATEAKRTGEITSAYAPQLAGMDQNVSNYYDTLKDTDYTDFNVQAPEDYQGGDLNQLTQEMMNPLTDTMVNTASNKVQGAAANAGNLFSGITAKNIANSTAQVQAEQYDKARQAAQTQQAQNYRQYTDKFANLLKANEVNKGNVAGNISNLGALNTAQTGALNTQQQYLNNLRNTTDTRMFDTQNAMATAQGQKAGTGSALQNFASGALSGLAGAL